MVFQKPVLFAGSVADNLRVADKVSDGGSIAELVAMLANGQTIVPQKSR